MFADDIGELAGSPDFLVEVRDPTGELLGYASHSPGSRIALRRLCGAEEGPPLDLERWFDERCRRALEARVAAGIDSDAFRVVASEADGVPGLVADRYADILVVQLGTRFLERHVDKLVPALGALVAPRAILGRNDFPARRLEGLEQRVTLYAGTRPGRVEIVEHGLRFVIDPWIGQKTGFFLDQRDARALVRRIAGGGRILDLFCYSGGFSVHAIAGGAREVVAVDASARALELLESNVEANRLVGRVHARRGKAAAVLRDLLDRGARFDGVIVDPPAFAKRRADRSRALHGYRELYAKAMRLVAPGGWLVACSCSHHLSPEDFVAVLREAAARSGRSFWDRGRLPPAADHPVLVGLPESDYLKVHWLEARD